MASEVQAEQLIAADWGGGAFPYRVGHRKLGMWLFIVSDSLTFSALLIGYSYVRASSDNWPTPFPFWPSIIFSSIMTLCLLSSSLTMVMAVKASARGDKAGVRRWILGTILGGASFIVLHLIEWNHLIDEGLRPFALPSEWAQRWPGASPLFGATFFAITGLHMFHVFTGLIYLASVAAMVKRLKHEDVEISGLYWHFVDLVWMFVFPMIYLLSVDFRG
ncbi:MAG: cytochrome oxidase subunit III [Acidobacteria bacterium 13_1_20CM_3_53_8]|nr:MAG: cytochrome oxidase subunit III [Acidobacteria bacterium 13_1_20CM_3_53_8]